MKIASDSVAGMVTPTCLDILEIEPRKVGQRYTKLSALHGLAVTQEGHLIVAESFRHCITIINTTEWNKVRSFGKLDSQQKEFNWPRGVALTQDGHIVVADRSNHRLQILTVEGTLVSVVGSLGSQPLQFRYPYGVAVLHNGKLFVTDKDNHHVQVLNSDLTYVHVHFTAAMLVCYNVLYSVNEKHFCTVAMEQRRLLSVHC